MRILATNDDGIRAPGLRALVDVAREFGEVKVAAPDYERSACGHAMTLRDPLRARQVDWEGVEAYEVDGLPVDCVNVGLSIAWPEGCDLVLAGFNNGPNLGFDITYSGTVAGAMEGAINNIPSYALSMASFVVDAPFHYETGARWLRENWEMLVRLPFDGCMLYNVNIPAIDFAELGANRFVGMGGRIWLDRVVQRFDPWNRPYYWQGGATALDADQPGSDVWAIRRGDVSITPVQVDWTHRGLLEKLQSGVSATDSV